MMTALIQGNDYGHRKEFHDEAAYLWSTIKASQPERFFDMFSKSDGLAKTWSEIKVDLAAA